MKIITQAIAKKVKNKKISVIVTLLVLLFYKFSHFFPYPPSSAKGGRRGKF